MKEATMWSPRRLALLLALVMASGCSAMFMLGSGTNVIDDDGEEGLNNTHVFSKSVSVLRADGEPVRIVHEVVRGQRYRASITLAWQNEDGPGDVERTWRFVREGKIYGSTTAEVDVDRSPFVFEIDGDSTNKKLGRYAYHLYVNDRVIAREDVKIVDTPSPKPTPFRPNRGW